MLMIKPLVRLTDRGLLPANRVVAQAAAALILSGYWPHKLIVEELTPKIARFIHPAL